MHAQYRLQLSRGQLASSADRFHSMEGDLPNMGTDATIAVTGGLSKSSTAASIKTDNDDDWISQSTNLDVLPGSSKEDAEEPTPTKGEWSVMDFPPLGRVKGETTTQHSVWVEKIPSKQTSPRSDIPSRVMNQFDAERLRLGSRLRQYLS